MIETTDPTEADLTLELAERRTLLAAVEQEFATLEHELPGLIEEHGAALDALAAMQPALQKAIAATRSDPNQQGVLIEPGWRRDNPAASQLHGQHELKEREAHALQIAITQRQLRRSTLKNSVLPHHRGQVEEVESLLEQHRAALADVQARQARGERSPFAELRRRVMGGPGRWQRDRSSRLSFAPSPRARALSRRPRGSDRFVRKRQQRKTTTQQALTSVVKWAGGLGLAATAANALGSALGASLEVYKEHERVTRATAAAYGSNASSFTRFSEALAASNRLHVAPSWKLHCRPGR